jgi:hypothetical protein
MTTLKLPDEVRQQLAKRYRTNCGRWLAREVDGWPIVMPLGVPTERIALSNTAALQSWTRAWQAWDWPEQVQWGERRWPALSAQRLPESLRLSTPEEIAALLGSPELTRWRRAAARFDALALRWPQLAGLLPRYFDLLSDYSEDDFMRLVRVVHWIVEHPSSGMYVRQIPVEGIDTKWIESRRQIVQKWVGTIVGSAAGERDFYDVCGLKRPPDLARIFVLDPDLRAKCGRLRDITAPVTELAQADIEPSVVLVVENHTTGQALPDIRGAVAIAGRGYAVELLGLLPWMRHAHCLYWGDIDLHGLAILNRARGYVPSLQSLMMDVHTYELHRTMLVHEPSTPSATTLSHLTDEEQELYSTLGRIPSNEPRRLEQERLSWAYVLEQLGTATDHAFLEAAPVRLQ